MAYDPLQRLQARQNKSQIYSPDTTASAIENEYQNLAEREATMSAISRAIEAEQAPQVPQFDFQTQEAQGSTQISETAQKQGSMLPSGVRITQAFGAYNPGVEVFIKSGRNWGTDFGVKEGTPLALPPGEWQVMEAYDKASGKGYIGNKENRGYGNSVLVKNTQTGETMRFSHLKGINVIPGKTYTGGTVLGASGATGNVTGAHLDLEYKNPQGQYQDILKSQYAQFLFGAMNNYKG